MKCYVCSIQGKTTEAVVVCKHCGVALCPEHLIEDFRTGITVRKYTCNYERPHRQLPQKAN